jgi:RNA polymerase sigma-70 factor, ECF subfamily
VSIDKNSIDKEVVISLKAGDRLAFEKVFFGFADRLYYFAMRYLRNQHDAEELVQEVFVKLWENRGSLNEELSFSGYLYTIARNTIFNQNRKRVNEKVYQDYVKNALQLASTKTEDDLIYADIKNLVDKVVEDLPPQRKLVYKMSRDQGLTYKEIAQELSLSERTVEAHIRLALKTITDFVDKQFVIPIILMLFAKIF